jgi:hypothetical protein
MTRLHDAFDALADRGEPVGADAVFASARDAVANGTVAELQRAVFAPRARFRIVAVAVVCVAVVVGAAVGLSTRDGTAPTARTVSTLLTQQSEAGLRSAATAYANAFLTGSYRDLIVVLDPTCAPNGAKLSSSQLAAGNATLQRFRLALKRQTGINPADIKIHGVAVRNYTGRAGQAEAEYALPAAFVGNDNWNRYAYSGGRWHIAGCDLIAPIGGQSTTSKTAVTGAAHSGPRLPPSVLGWLRNYSARRSLGKATSADWVLTTHGKAAIIVSGALPSDTSPVYLFDVHGNFVWDHSCQATAPRSACRSIGAHEVFTLDAQRLEVLDFTVQPEAANLAQFGAVGHVTL